jgi:hypothetical protein
MISFSIVLFTSLPFRVVEGPVGEQALAVAIYVPRKVNTNFIDLLLILVYEFALVVFSFLLVYLCQPIICFWNQLQIAIPLTLIL